MQIRFIYRGCFFTEQSCVHSNTRGAKMSKTFPGNFRIQILNRRNNTLDAGGDQCIGTRWRATVVRMRFEGNVSGAAPSFVAREIKRDRLSMFDGFENVETFAGNLACGTDDDTTNKWS